MATSKEERRGRRPSAAGAIEPSRGAPSRKPEALGPGLYLVATPIGNARDITLRALDVLGDCDAILCEDTRRTAKLLALHGIRKTLISYHEHNAEAMRPKALARLQSGERLALVSDAGTPLISDPGFKLVRAALHEGLHVTALPGASAVLAALELSGLPCERFAFFGFLPSKEAQRRAVLREFASLAMTLVFFESPRRLAPTLRTLAELYPGRAAAVARELTKLFEEVRRGPIEDLARHYRDSGAPKGEVVLLVGPPVRSPLAPEDVDRLLKERLEQAPLKEAVARLAGETGLPRRTLYSRALALRAGRTP
jgi:16S rRNA (cytidine1402-2'-O)-methyltransferase